MNDSTINILCRSILNFHLEGRDLHHPVLLANIGNEGLLGLDFMLDHNMAIDFT